MKANIDLTENRDFRESNDWSIIRGWRPYNLPIPAFSQPSINEPEPDEWGIKQGNALDRYLKELHNKWSNGMDCDRCGRKIYPYYHNTVCQYCEEDMSYEKPEWFGA
jgi:hypothetical protein